MLKQLGNYLNTKNGYLVAGKNSQTFDVCFLGYRYIARNIGVPLHIKQNHSEYRPMLDIQDAFYPSARNSQATNLSNLAFMMDVPDKTAHGSQSTKFHKDWIMGSINGDTTAKEKLVDYCRNDVRITAEFFRRFHKPFVSDVESDGFENKINKL